MKSFASLRVTAAVVFLCFGCDSSATPPPRPQPPAPEPQRFPEPPALPADASLCVVRTFEPGDGWQSKTWGYDATARVIGGWMHFDAQGRMTTSEDSSGRDTRSYDEHGNLMEEARWQGEELREGTRWDNRYEGEPARLVAQNISRFRKRDERSQPHARVRYHYDAEGRVDEEWNEGRPRGQSKRRFVWQGQRIVAIYESTEPRSTSDKLPYDGSETFEYDAQGRLAARVLDGDTFGEGGAADGKPDQRETFHYDQAGHLASIERDGQIGDIGPEAPDGKPDAVKLLSAPCDPLVKLGPELFRFPEINLPNSITPPMR